MKQQQNKRSEKNYKRNNRPAKLLKIQYIALNQLTIKADFDTEEEINEFLINNPDCKGYIIKTYSLNNKKLSTTQKLED